MIFLDISRLLKTLDIDTNYGGNEDSSQNNVGLIRREEIPMTRSNDTKIST